MNHDDPKSDKLETFLRRWLSQNPRWQYASPGWPANRRSPEEIASALLADAEFAEVGLADWLNSPDGQLIETAVGRVLPMPQAIEFQVLVDALTLAAQAQQRGQRKLAAVATVVAAVAAYLIYASFKPRHGHA